MGRADDGLGNRHLPTRERMMSSSTWVEEVMSDAGNRLGWIVVKWDNAPSGRAVDTTWTAVPAPGNPKAWVEGSVEFSDRETAHAHLCFLTGVAG